MPTMTFFCFVALSYLNPSAIEAKDDAFWAFSAARHVDFIWGAALEGTGAENLYDTHMGKGLQEFREQYDIAYMNPDQLIQVHIQDDDAMEYNDLFHEVQ